MEKTLPIYILAAAVALASLILGLLDVPFWFIRSTRTAAIVFAAAGFVMCATGMISTFIPQAPVHPLTIVAYLVGLFALFIGIVQVFNLSIPPFSDPKLALILMGAAVVVKVVIGRLAFLIRA
jgi:hypothetical protein